MSPPEQHEKRLYESRRGSRLLVKAGLTGHVLPAGRGRAHSYSARSFLEAAMPLAPRVGLIMGSKSDWETLRAAAEMLDALGVTYESRVVSAHRTPQRLYDYATTAKARGLKVIIAAAGGAAHLPGMCASMTPLPVLGVPVKSAALNGLDSLLSIVQMPKGVPVGTLAIGDAGAANAAILAASILALSDEALASRLDAFRAAQTAAIGEDPASA
jgi:5-(carboxyamino)imidazole ribonucleotide mutase